MQKPKVAKIKWVCNECGYQALRKQDQYLHTHIPIDIVEKLKDISENETFDSYSRMVEERDFGKIESEEFEGEID
jgi:thymidine kinase